MKDMVLVPIKFVIFLMVVLFIGTAMQVLIDFSRLSPGLQREWASTISLLTVNGFFVWIMPAVGFTWLISSFAILRRGKAKRIRMIFLTLLVMGTMFSILYFMPPLDRVRSHVSELDFQVPEQAILSHPDAFFVFGGTGGKSGTVLLHRTAPDARFRIIPDATKDLAGGRVVMGSEGLSIPMDSVIGGRQNLFEDPQFISPITRFMMDGLVAFQADRAGNILQSAILAVAMALLLASFWLFVRLTQWPLANLVLTLGMLIGVVAVASFLSSEVARELLAFVPIGGKIYVLPGVYALISLFCFGGTLLLPSRKDWQPGVNE